MRRSSILHSQATITGLKSGSVTACSNQRAKDQANEEQTNYVIRSKLDEISHSDSDCRASLVIEPQKQMRSCTTIIDCAHNAQAQLLAGNDPFPSYQSRRCYATDRLLGTCKEI